MHTQNCYQIVKTAWILNHYAVLPSETGSTRHFEIATRLAEKNWTCVVLAASFSHWERKQRISGYRCFADITQGKVSFRFIWTPSYSNNGISRVINMLSYFVCILLPCATKRLPKPDVIIGSSVHPLAALAAQILARRYGVPFVFEVRDLWPQTLIAMKHLDGHGLTAKLMYFLERWLYKHACKIIVLLPYAFSYITQYGISRNKIEWIPNGVDISSNPRKCKHPNILTFMYIGAHGEANGLDVILDAIKSIKGKEFSVSLTYRFIGEGEAKERLIARARKNGLDNVIFEKGVPKNRVAELLAEADVLILAVRDLPELYQYGISMNKIFDYMAAEKPIVAALSAANDPIRDANAGITVAADRPAELGDAIARLAMMPADERKILGKNGRDYVAKYHDYAVLSEKYNTLLSELL